MGDTTSSFDQLFIGSPYRSRKQPCRQSLSSFTIHSLLFVVTAYALVRQSVRSNWSEASVIAVLFSSSWLIVGPTLVTAWCTEFRRLRDELGPEAAPQPGLSAVTTTRLRATQWCLVALPPLLMVVAYQNGDAFLDEVVGMPQGTLAFWVGQLVLVVGGLAAGWGLAAAAVTIVLGHALAAAPSTFDPFASVTLEPSHHLARFCFRSALYFGAGGALLIPGIVAGVVESSGLTTVTLVAVVTLIMGVSIAMLAVPALMLSNRHVSERDRYLASISYEVGVLADRAATTGSGFGNEDYARLRALIDIHNYVVQRSGSPPAVEMTKRIPLAVVLPLLSILGAWASALQ